MKNFLFYVSCLCMLGVTIVSLWSKNELDSVRKEANLDKDQTFILVHADPRLGTVQTFVKEIFSFVHDYELGIPILFASSIKGMSYVDDNVLSVDKWKDPREYSHYYFVVGDVIYKEGRVMYGTKALKESINRYYDVIMPPQVEDYFELGENARSSNFSEYYEKGPTVFFLFENICMVCESGAVADYISKRRVDGLMRKIIVFEKYRDSDLFRFQEDYGFENDFVSIANKELMALWKGVDNDFTEKHLFHGLIIGVGLDEQISFLGDVGKLEEFEKWVTQQSNQLN